MTKNEDAPSAQTAAPTFAPLAPNPADPSGVQQALQSFLTSAESLQAIPQLTAQQLQSLQQPPDAQQQQQQQPQPQAPQPQQQPVQLQLQPVPEITAQGQAQPTQPQPQAPLLQLPADPQQQQLIWQQALQSLGVVPSAQNQQVFTAAQQPQQQPQQPQAAFLQAFPQLLLNNNANAAALTQPTLATGVPIAPGLAAPTASTVPTNGLIGGNAPVAPLAGSKRKAPDPPYAKLAVAPAASVVSLNGSYSAAAPPPAAAPPTSTAASATRDGVFDDVKPPTQKSAHDLARMTPSERRRYERNLREQQRSYKISQQIKQLRDVLHESNIPFRPNKYSILVSVAEYIQQLQSRAIMLDSEHQRLIDTIRKTNDLVASGGTISGSESSGVDNHANNKDSVASGMHPNLAGSNSSSSCYDGASAVDLCMVQGIDYKAAFAHCPYPLGVATLDGRMLDCNEKMEALLQVKPGTMRGQSFFVFIRNHQEIFEAMAALLKRSTAFCGKEEQQRQLLFWCGHILSPRSEKFSFTITLTNSADENPKYFSLSASASSTSA